MPFSTSLGTYGLTPREASLHSVSVAENHRKFFSDVALVGPTLFFSQAFSQDELAKRFERPTPDTARDFLVLRTLAEVQKYGVSARRWHTVEKNFQPGDRYDEVEAESLLLDRVAWQRRLLEALVALINFSSTNDVRYFHHFLAVQEFARHNQRLGDERIFFGNESELTRANIATLRHAVDAARAQLHEPADCWYLRRGEKYKSASLRSQYIRALKLATASEKTALGYTYAISFGAASERLHFGVLDAPHSPTPGDDVAESLSGLLTFAIIARAHDLCGVEPAGVNKVLVARARTAKIPEFLAPALAVGDFVLTTGPHIAEILDIRTTDFGYVSFRVKFLDDVTGPGLAEDWLPALAVRIFMTRHEMIGGLQTRLAEHSMEGQFDEKQMVEASREAVVEMWKLGLRAYYLRQIEMAKNKAGSETTSEQTGSDGTAATTDPPVRG